jgi:hypothetical protein
MVDSALKTGAAPMLVRIPNRQSFAVVTVRAQAGI